MNFSLEYKLDDCNASQTTKTWEYQSSDYGEYGLQIKDGLFEMKAYGGPETEKEFVFLLPTSEQSYIRDEKISYFPVPGNSIDRFRTKIFSDKSCSMKLTVMLEVNNKYIKSEEYEVVFVVPVSVSKELTDGAYFLDDKFSGIERILYFPFGSDRNTDFDRMIKDVHFYEPKVAADEQKVVTDGLNSNGFLASHDWTNDELDFKEFLISREWAAYKYTDSFNEVVNTTELEIDSFKIHDLDRCGEGELLLTAHDYSGMFPFGISAIFKMADNKPVKIISAAMSGGSIGGEMLSIDYDRAHNRYVICKNGSAGGFGGRSIWSEYYILREEGLEAISSHSMLSQLESNFTDLNEYDFYYLDDGIFASGTGDVYTVYHVNGENVDEETYKFEVNRFIKLNE